jgi:hypothetical protein
MQLQSLVEDSHNGSLSSRRIVTLAAFILCSIAFLANLFFSYSVDQYMFDGMMYIVIAGLGVIVTEKFATKTER